MFLGQRSKINSSAYLTNIPCNDQIDIKVLVSSYLKAGTTGQGLITQGSQPVPLLVPNQLENRTKFVKPGANGNLRDVLTVECAKIDVKRFNGSITLTEARTEIFNNKLGLPQHLLYSVKMSFSKCRTITLNTHHYCQQKIIHY